MAITSLTITYEGNDVWSYNDNTMPSGATAGASFYDGTWNLDLVTFKTDNGGILYNNIPYDIIEYIDSTNPSNNYTPTSAKDLIVFLKGINFFDKGISGGSGADTLLELDDVFIANYFGRALQVLRVNAAETGVESFAAALVQNFTDLLDTPNVIGVANKNKFVAVNNAGNALVYVPNPLINFTIPIAGFGVFNIAKGYHWEGSDLVLNSAEEFEIGDFCSVTLYVNNADPNEGVILIPHARYKGGSQDLAASFEYNYSEKIAFDSEPDSET